MVLIIISYFISYQKHKKVTNLNETNKPTNKFLILEHYTLVFGKWIQEDELP